MPTLRGQAPPKLSPLSASPPSRALAAAIQPYEPPA